MKLNANEALNQLTCRMAKQTPPRHSYTVQIGESKKHTETAFSVPDLVSRLERKGLYPIHEIQHVQAGYWIFRGGPSPVHVWKNL